MIESFKVGELVIFGSSDKGKSRVEEIYGVNGPNGELLTVLNPTLAATKDVSFENLEALKLSHQLKYLLFEAARHETVKDSPVKLKLLAAVFDALESEQQKLWNFVVDQNHHRFFDFPGCTCPKLDNQELLGQPTKIYSQDCPIHGDRVRV